MEEKAVLQFAKKQKIEELKISDDFYEQKKAVRFV
jgi:hypothetical protein